MGIRPEKSVRDKMTVESEGVSVEMGGGLREEGNGGKQTELV